VFFHLQEGPSDLHAHVAKICAEDSVGTVCVCESETYLSQINNFDSLMRSVCTHTKTISPPLINAHPPIHTHPHPLTHTHSHVLTQTHTRRHTLARTLAHPHSCTLPLKPHTQLHNHTRTHLHRTKSQTKSCVKCQIVLPQ